MSLARPKLLRPDTGKRTARTQYGALCWRDGPTGVEVCLVTTRGRGRWIVPKGWPVPGATPLQTAQQEAWEEAGVRGVGRPGALGLVASTKRWRGRRQPFVIAVFEIEVTTISKTWPEHRARKRRWMSPKAAAKRVADPELAALLRGFVPRRA